jgi:hypothetical protein
LRMKDILAVRTSLRDVIIKAGQDTTRSSRHRLLSIVIPGLLFNKFSQIAPSP